MCGLAAGEGEDGFGYGFAAVRQRASRLALALRSIFDGGEAELVLDGHILFIFGGEVELVLDEVGDDLGVGLGDELVAAGR